MSEKKDWLSIEEQKYISSNKYVKDFPALDKTLAEPRFLISELGVTARDATYWDKQGVLPEMKGSGARRKYDLVQAVWIRLIIQMRKFGVSIPIIKAFKSNLLGAELSSKDILKNPKVLQVMRDLAKREGSEQNFEDLLSSGELEAKLSGESIDLFYNLIRTVILFRKPISLLVSLEGDFVPYSLEMHTELLKTDRNFHEAFEIPHFSLSISSAYQGLVKDWSTKSFFREISLISDKEQEVLLALREEGLKSVTIKFVKGELDLMETVKDGKVDLASRFLDVISKNGFHTVIIKSRRGNIVHYENKEMKKFKSTK